MYFRDIVEDKQKKCLRKGYTTGACAAAAGKAAAIAFLTGKKVKEVQITLPLGQTVKLPVHRCKIEKDSAAASIIKDAGDDPDVTNGAEIVAEVATSAISNFKFQISNFKRAFQFTINSSQFTVYGGSGIGIVTKPGLAVKVGEPAINPVPRKMIEDAIRDVLMHFPLPASHFQIIISVPNGEEIAKKTMSARLGIIGGISILGTTGIVEPVSLSAYRNSITCAIDVAMASGCKEIVFSTGRSSEKVAEKELKLPEETFILVGDHMGFALKKIGVRGQGSGVRKVTIAGQFGKFSKLAAGHFETHCSDSSVELEFIASLVKDAGAKEDIIETIKSANTARQVFFILKEQGLENVLKIVCKKTQSNAKKIVDSTVDIGCMLMGYNNEVVERV
ncbi:MAG: cobalt-precorrin-5B (C(1))-methyltransferase CbiD [Deltaproteobacteria bacterium]|nr:cobalt-precorrin-5B (C(1))-methyltransferase CbiD [Deltaproteobacteria bacterium]